MLPLEERVGHRARVTARLRPEQHGAVGKLVGRPGDAQVGADARQRHVADLRRRGVADDLAWEREDFAPPAVGRLQHDARGDLGEEGLQRAIGRGQAGMVHGIGRLHDDASRHLVEE